MANEEFRATKLKFKFMPKPSPKSKVKVRFDYYWREFTGEIPEDAVPGGWDCNRDETYIAQVYVPKNGVLPTRLYKGDKTVTACHAGIHTSDRFIKVLCSKHVSKFVWLPVSAKNFNTETIDKHVVVGGCEGFQTGNAVSIGRTQYQGELIVGKAADHHVGNAKLYFPYKGQEKDVEFYEVLTFENNSGFHVKK